MLEPIKTYSDKEIAGIGEGELAYVGDCVFELFVRAEIALAYRGSAGKLHELGVRRVRASAQALAAAQLIPQLTEDEAGVFRRGRNLKHASVPHGCTRAEYAQATALEALFGWLYLTGRTERLTELYKAIKPEEAQNA